ncbi:ATP-dependent DNA ligase [Durotheca rogersii]|uniref:ATP-dependent DNA ligase n=1 Tax=Durotheca rogersii TaxID=419775 RepID=UPI00221EC9D6|nr:ATP-dependent DNA ligase [Durotheca rogersii]KAI5863094.1 ATP-dependent DNA ligase [Durotheca rogersii]
MAPKQATLGRFFGQPNGSKPAPKQTTLSFSTKTSKKVKEESEPAAEQEASSGGAESATDAATESTADASTESAADAATENTVPVKDTRKRSRSTSPRLSASKKASTKVKVEAEEDLEELEEEEEAPTVKRRRRTRRRVEEDEDEDEDEDDVSMSGAEPVKPRKRSSSRARSPKKAAATSPAAKKRGRPPKREASESASEVEDDEVEKPEAAAKTRKKLQKKLAIPAEDPYPDWEAGTPVPYAALCATFSLIELTSGRLAITEYCSRFLRQVLRLTPDDFLPTVLLMINKLAPDYAGIELGIGESLIMKSIGETTGRSLQIIKADQKEIGDLGLVAIKSKSTQPTMFKLKPLTVRGVHQGLMEIATAMSGTGAQTRKVDGIKKLLSAADAHSTVKADIHKDKGGPSEAKYLVRFLEGKLRLGLADKTVIVAIAQAMAFHEAAQKGTEPSPQEIEAAETMLKTAYSEIPSWNVIIPAMIQNGIMKLRESCRLRPGLPLKPMLAKPTKAITEVLDRFENQTFTCEYKYDGERTQIHYVAKDHTDEYIEALPGATKESTNGVSSIFSRNSEDLSKKYPDVLAKLPTWVKESTKSFVIDCEAVAWDAVEKKIMPFQTLMTRKRKDVKIEDVKIKVCIFAFDLLYLNGEAVVQKSLRERRELLCGAFQPTENEFAFASHMDGQDLEEIQTFLDESVKASCEGLMVKMLDGAESGYEPSKRSRNWLKIKKDYLAGVGDSLDLVVLGAYHGKGKRTSVYGSFLLGCYNAALDIYETVCNIGTGFSEQLLEELHAQLFELVIDRPKPFYAHSAGGQHQPDVWFEPRYVWEVRTADLTLSPRYQAGLKDGADPAGEKGISLRFPRFIKIREDKKPDEATSSRQIVEMYRKQESVAKNKGPSVDDDFEY